MTAAQNVTSKVSFSGHVLSVQPRIRLLRSFDQVSHSYLGFVICLRGQLDSEERDFSVAIGEAAHEEHQIRLGDAIRGEASPVADRRLETADLYKVAKLKIVERGAATDAPPPWHGVAPALPTYRERGHRRLYARTYDTKCTSCIWGCRMPVEIILDQWNRDKKQYREETFCYGPLSCALYKAGPTRKVPGRKGMSWEEEDWIDQEAVAHRGPDD